MKKMMIIGLVGLFVGMSTGLYAGSSTCKAGYPIQSQSSIHPNIHRAPYSTVLRQGSVLFVEDPGDSAFGPLTKPDTLWQGTLDAIFGPGLYGWYGPTLTRSENGPDSLEMMNYELVIWNCYDYWFRDTAALTADDTVNIAAYLANQGKVWLLGQDLLWSGVPMEYMLAYFHLQSALQDYVEDEPDINLHGLVEIDSINILARSDYVWNGFYPDELFPSAGAHAVLKDADMNKNVGIFYPGPGDWQTAFWSMDGRNPSPSSEWIHMVTDMLLAFGITGVGERPEQDVISGLSLTISPDPMVNATTLKYGIPLSGHVRLRIYDRAGKYVVAIVDEHKDAGVYSAIWNAQDKDGAPVANGVYFVRFECNKLMNTASLVVIR
jgi:hypothetical protein